MITGYFNHTLHVADSRWDRQRFLRSWWRIYASDPRWAPLYYPGFRNLLRADLHPHLRRLHPQLIHLEALPSRRQRDDTRSGSLGTVLFEESVAAAILLLDDRSGARTAYLGELRVANDGESLEHFLNLILERLWQVGCRRMIGPTGISPMLRSGVLMNRFDETPPMHTAYNPPYMAEILGSVMHVLARQQLFVVPVPDDYSPNAGPVTINLVGMRHGGSRLLPLLAACSDWPAVYPTPDLDELRYVVRWLESQAPLYALVAKERGRLLGIVLLQADQSHRLRRAHGGRNLLWRWWFQWRRSYPVDQGRMIVGGVLPEARGTRHWQAIVVGYVGTRPTCWLEAAYHRSSYPG